MVDDVLVYRGSLLPSPSQAQLLANDNATAAGSSASSSTMDWGCTDLPDLSQVILFTNDPKIVSKETSRVPMAQDEIVFLDEGLPVDADANDVDEDKQRGNSLGNGLSGRSGKSSKKNRRPMTSVNGPRY